MVRGVSFSNETGHFPLSFPILKKVEKILLTHGKGRTICVATLDEPTRVEQMKHYNVKEYHGDRPCIDPLAMVHFQIRCRSGVTAKPNKLATLVTKIKNLIK